MTPDLSAARRLAPAALARWRAALSAKPPPALCGWPAVAIGWPAPLSSCPRAFASGASTQSTQTHGHASNQRASPLSPRDTPAPAPVLPLARRPMRLFVCAPDEAADAAGAAMVRALRARHRPGVEICGLVSA
jgi:hypothetical protein